VPLAGLATTFLPLLFPDGRLVSHRWRLVAVLDAVAIVVLSVLLSLYPGPIDNAPYLDNPLVVPEAWTSAVLDATFVAFLLLAASIVLSGASVVVRFRRSRGTARQQLKWFAAAAVLAGLMLAGPGTLLNIVVAGNPRAAQLKITQIITIVGLMTIPIATGIAVLRYRLYEIDRVLSRTIAWAAVTALLAAIFVAGVLSLQTALASLTGGSTLAVAASTLVVAGLAQPVTRRVQALVDRRFFRARYDAAQATEMLAGQLRAQMELETIRRDLAATVIETMHPAATALWIRRAGS
jgi:hypothetical protein